MFTYGIRGMADRQELDKIAQEQMNALALPIRKFEIRYCDQTNEFSFAGILEFLSSASRYL